MVVISAGSSGGGEGEGLKGYFRCASVDAAADSVQPTSSLFISSSLSTTLLCSSSSIRLQHCLWLIERYSSASAWWIPLLVNSLSLSLFPSKLTLPPLWLSEFFSSSWLSFTVIGGGGGGGEVSRCSGRSISSNISSTATTIVFFFFLFLSSFFTTFFLLYYLSSSSSSSSSSGSIPLSWLSYSCRERKKGTTFKVPCSVTWHLLSHTHTLSTLSVSFLSLW